MRAIQEARDKDADLRRLADITKYRKLDNFFVAPDRMQIAVQSTSKLSWTSTEAS